MQGIIGLFALGFLIMLFWDGARRHKEFLAKEKRREQEERLKYGGETYDEIGRRLQREEDAREKADKQ